MGGDAVACEVVVDGELVERAALEHLDVTESLQQFVEEGRDESFLFGFVDLVAAVLEGVAVVLHPAVVQPLPLPLVDPFQQLQLLLPAHHILQDHNPRNALVWVGRAAVGDGEGLAALHELLLAVEEDEGSGEVLVGALGVVDRTVLHLLAAAHEGFGVLTRLELQDAVRTPWNYLRFMH